jgi:hypothetical protein
MQRFLFALCVFLVALRPATAQVYDAAGNDVTGMNDNNDRRGGNFNPHNNDTTHQNKQVPKGIYVWTVDRKFGDIRPAEVDTMPHLFPLATMNTGMASQYNTTGNNYSARQSRIFNERPVEQQFALVDAYSYFLRQPDEFHFTNTLSPITNLWYDNCGDKTNGEDHLFARFAVNAGKRLGMGFNFNYAYARGYYSNQNISHFNGTAYLSYLGDRYQAHLLFSTNHQKASENGGISSDEYITQPELFTESYSTNEIPTELHDNWNRDHNYHVFLTHRYSMGFYRDVPMTEAEIEARKFAEASKKEQEERQQKDKEQKSGKDGSTAPKGRPAGAQIAAGRPEGALIAGDEPAKVLAATDSTAVDSTRITVTSKEQADSLLAIAAPVDSASLFMKKVFVPVTSFIHTLELDHYEHIYQAYYTPANYYVNTYYNNGINNAKNDSIYDTTRYLQVKNTVALALLEGFNKWAKAGIKAFATHQLRRYDIPTVLSSGQAVLGRWTEHNVSVGGQLQKTQGKTLHYQAQGEVWMTGEDAGQVKLDFQTDLNFPMLGDTVRLAAKAHFYNQHPDFFFRHFHSKHFWWDNSLNNITRTKVEGLFAYEKTHTRLRLAVEELQNYTYLGMAYDFDNSSKKTTQVPRNVTAEVKQYSSNLNVLMAQIEQPLALGPLHWDNTVTYQSSSNKEVLPLPALNVFSNLYLKFVYAHVLSIELGAAGTWFTKYYAPDFCPQLNQFAIQQTSASRIEMGNQPFVDLYANLHLKHARFFVMMSNVTGESGRRMNFLTPHYPLNSSVLHLGVSWNFFN